MRPAIEARTSGRGRPNRSAAQSGFTIIEVLVSIMLLSVIVLVVLAPLTGLFGITRRSDEQMSATQAAQRTLEAIRGDWLSGTYYRQACVSAPVPTLVPPIQVEVSSLNQQGEVTAVRALNAVCPLASDDPPMRRVRVTVQVGQAVSILAVDVARP